MTDWATNEQRAKVIAAYGSLAIPICIAIATIAINYNQQTQAAAESCREKTLKLYDEASDALDKLQRLDKAGQSVKADITNRQAIALGLLLESCKRGGVEVPSGVHAVIERLSAYSPEATTRESLAASAKTAGEIAQPTPSVAAAVPKPAAPGVVRVYLHIADEAQRPAARALENSLERQTIAGRRIVVPGIELVGSAQDSSLRCLKREDCAKAPDLMVAVTRVFPQLHLVTYDLSARYQNESGVKAGTYEIWLGKNAVLSERRQ